MYGNTDIFRIKDIIHSVDQGQWMSKQWLADMMYMHHKHPGKIVILGGWYGLQAFMLRKHYKSSEMHIVSIDSDPRCEELGYKLFGDQDIDYWTMDVRDSKLDLSDCSILVSTSIEHFDRDDVCQIVSLKPDDCWVALQTSNMFRHPSHINCSTDVEEFVEYVQPHLSKKRVLYSGTLQLHNFKRMMLIGK